MKRTDPAAGLAERSRAKNSFPLDPDLNHQLDRILKSRKPSKQSAESPAV
jgi:hypothetical protein